MSLLDILAPFTNHTLRRHRVRPGDNLAILSQTYYGTPAHALVIFQHNTSILGSDPNNLPVGICLIIPHIPHVHG